MPKKLEVKYTKLFLKHVSRNFTHDKKGNALHPFEFFEKLLSEEGFEVIEFRNFDNGFIFYNNLQKQAEHSFNWFQYEYSLIKGSNEYLNKIVNKLLGFYKLTRTFDKQYEFKKGYFNLIETVLKNILEKIFTSYHLDLNKSNRIYLSKWYYLKEPINSFKFSKYPEDKRLKELYDKYLKTSFIHYNTPFVTFKALFENRTLVNKINWVDQKTTLYFFIKLLRQHKVIKNTKNKHWIIASEFFLLKGETLIPKDFLNQKEPQTKKKRELLEKFVLALKI
ncbi:hypothetical protein [Flavivirga jejuensis]|uniref:Uncharacterized protein n=1 Tax=Flavivirga jejuensis TaxID=870487 RepID=A0ABT8WV76_9FLAO|nr:hypothetical protein [Flavivirga jejuensis]MDO5977077.1 hypothetical protein [Flavivirga jejuensis]